MKDLIPKCLLADLIKQKYKKHATTDFKYVTQLNTFLEKVKRDIPAIHTLFPQFTPHDDLHHLEPLFKLASDLLGKQLLKSLNITELFLLACALYGHDWGMAVDELCKQKIMSDFSIPETDRCIEEDRKRLRLFLTDVGYEITEDSVIKDLDIDTWREFVRRTHTQRSYDRIRRYFENIDQGVATRLSQICESHGKDCDKLRDQDLYPIRCSILGEVVNLRAIAIYLRLSDLFDLADNRTPYAIWKNVAPSDLRAVKEWDKHRAIRQITFPSYPGNVRHVLVDSSTNDNELYTELEDLEDYCQKEFRFCLDILSEMPDNKYYMNVVALDWKIRAEGFKPIPIRFEFDREKMFGFLSHELYQGDKLVFLRELLQNSIDAIRMRNELLHKAEKIPLIKDLGYIEVFIENNSDGSVSIIWKDNGIGMDEKTIQNFVAIIGRSYYRSHEFQRLNLAMDPISEFGIGLLTCFTVSNGIEILTKRDQNLFSDSKPIRVQIPDIDRHFRIEEIKSSSAVRPGTIVRLTIDSKSINSLKSNNTSSKIFTDYLRDIAGFVEFPIVIHEGKQKTIILHPKADPKIAISRFGSDCEIVQLRLNNVFEDMVISEDVPVAKQLFKMEIYDLAVDLGLDGYEGILSYPIPLDENTDFTGGPRQYDALKVLTCDRPDMIGKFIRIMSGWQGQLIPIESLEGTKVFKAKNVYRDGILIPHVEIQEATLPRSSPVSLLTSLVVNIPKTTSKEISLARNQIITDSSEWAGPIFSAHIKTLARKYGSSSRRLEKPSHYLFRLASFLVFHGLSGERLSKVFPLEGWPFPFLETSGDVNFKRYGEIIQQPINRSAEPLSHVNTHLMQSLIEDKEIPEIFSLWRGPNTLIDDYATWDGSNNDSIILAALRYLIKDSIMISHRFDTIIFLTPPWSGNPPLLQEVWVPKNDSDVIPNKLLKSKLALLSKDPSNVFELEQPYVQKSFFEIMGVSRFHPRLVRFPKPFEKSFAYGDHAMNLNHPIVQALLHLMSIAFAKENYWKLPTPEIKAMRLMLRRIINLPEGILSDYSSWADSTSDLWKIVDRMGFDSHLGVRTLTPTVDQFVPGSTEQFLDIKVHNNWNKPFGLLVK